MTAQSVLMRVGFGCPSVKARVAKSPPADGALYTIQPDSQNLRRIWDGYAHASWSPDGRNIAVWTPLLPDDTGVWLIEPTGAIRTPLIKRNDDGGPIAGSPP